MAVSISTLFYSYETQYVKTHIVVILELYTYLRNNDLYTLLSRRVYKSCKIYKNFENFNKLEHKIKLGN